MMETVLGSRNKIKLLRVLARSADWQFNLSAIAREAGIDKGAVSKLVAEFEAHNVLEVKRSGKLLLFRVRDDYREILKKLFVLEKQWPH